jgi:hypothetical protein
MGDAEDQRFVGPQWKEDTLILNAISADMEGMAKLSAQSTKRRVRQWWIHLKSRNPSQLCI